MKLSEMVAGSGKVKTKEERKSKILKREPSIPAADAVHGSDTSINKKMPFKEIEPSRCRPWRHHNRSKLWLNDQKCGTLIESIKNEGQRQMGLVRPLVGDPDYDYEIIYGVRRWYSCSRIEGRRYKAEITTADDAECARLMNLENEESEDITEFEKACAYKDQIESGIFKEKQELATALNVSTALVSRLTRAARIMDNELVADLLSNKVLDISIRGAFNLAELLSTDEKKKKIEVQAAKIKASESQDDSLSASQIIQSLIECADTKAKRKVEKTYLTHGKRKLIVAKRSDSGKITITIDNNLSTVKGEKASEEAEKILSKIVSELL